jgi:hypothetical protein
LGLVPLVWAGGAIGACSGAGEEEEAVASRQEGLAGGSADPSSAQSPEANIVVAIETADGAAPACSGVLVTPTVVLTARPCVDPARVGAWPTVRVGSSFAGAARYFSTRPPLVQRDPTLTTHLRPSDPVTVDVNEQLALVYLDPRKPVLEAALIPRQLLQYPVSNVNPNADGSWTYPNVAVAGWSNTGLPAQPADGGADGGANNVRQRYFYSNGVNLLSNTDFTSAQNPFWLRDTSDGLGKLADVDVGGPIYVQQSAAATADDRQVFGIAVATGVAPGQVDTGACPPDVASCDIWVDIVDPPNLAWIQGNLGAPRTASWLRQHPRSDGAQSWWLGEVDYTGPCTPAVDADCDHWLDQGAGAGHDDCPGWFNPDQLDIDDDGIGDVCDNCPAFANPGQGSSVPPPSAPVVPPVGRVAEGNEELSAFAAGDGCRLWSVDPGAVSSFNANDVWVRLPSDAWQVGPTGIVQHWDGTAWTATDTPTSHNLYSVWGASANNVFAAGAQGTILHFDGSTWKDVSSGSADYNRVWGTANSPTQATVWVVPYAGNDVATWNASTSSWTPQNAGLPARAPNGVTAIYQAIGGTSADDVWIGGYGLLGHYGGSSWSGNWSWAPALRTLPSDFSNALVNSIWAASPDDVWAVGSIGNQSEVFRFNGVYWWETARGTVPCAFNAVTGRAPNDVVFAADNGTLWHWDGKSLSQAADLTLPLKNLTARPDGLWAASRITRAQDPFGIWRRRDLQWTTALPSDGAVRAVAAAGPTVVGLEDTGNAFVWNGASASAAADHAAVPMSAAWASGPSDVWGAGYTVGFVLPGDGGTTGASQLVHFDGGTWAPSAPPGGLINPHGVGGTSRSDVWVVGALGAIEHFDGSAWSPSASGTTQTLNGVWAVGPTDVWAVGDSGTALHWDGVRWTSVPGFESTSRLTAVWGAASNDVWAAGPFGFAHWDGAAWQRVEVGFHDAVSALVGAASGDVWALLGQDRVVHYDGTAWSTFGVTGAGGLTSAAVGAGGLWVGSANDALSLLQRSPFGPPSCLLASYQNCGQMDLQCKPIAASVALQRQAPDGSFQTVETASPIQAVSGVYLADAPTVAGPYTYRVCNADAFPAQVCAPPFTDTIVACPPDNGGGDDGGPGETCKKCGKVCCPQP